MWKAILNKWLNFTLFPPPLGILLAPLFMMFTMVLAIFSFANFVLFLIHVVGLLVSYRYRTVGFVCTVAAFLSYFLLYYLMGYEDIMWKIGWGCSLFLGFAIFFLSTEERISLYCRERERGDKTIAKLKHALHNINEQKDIEKRVFEEEIKEWKKQCCSLKQEIEGALSFVESSRVESEKVCKQNEALSTESLMQHRKIEAMKQDFALLKEAMNKLHSSDENLSLSDTQGLHALNKTGEELCRTQLLLERREEEPPQSSALPNEKNYYLTLQTLEKDREGVKKNYNQIQKDLVLLKKAVEGGGMNKDDGKRCAEIKKLKVQVAEKRKRLEMEKARLIDIERDIFVTKKQLQEEGTFVY